MPVTASDLVKKLLTKAGVAYDGDLTAEIPDEIATSLDNQLLTIAAATNNHPQVKKVYFAQAYNGLDAEIENAMTEFALDDDTKAEIKGEQSSTKKAVALARKIKELESKKVGADQGKTNTLQAQINDLHTEIANEKKKQADLKKTYEDKIKGIHIQSKLSSLLSGYKTIYDDLPAEAKEAAVNALISKALQDSDAEFTFDEKGSLSLIKKDGTNLFGDNHTQLTPNSFIDKTFSSSKILKVSETTPASNGNIQSISVPAGTKTGNPALTQALTQSRQNYEKATA